MANAAAYGTVCDVRRAGEHDLDFVLRAQAACCFDTDVELPADVVMAGLRSGQLEVYILDANEVPRMCVSVQSEGNRALLAAFYREGPPKGLLREAEILLVNVEAMLKARGIEQISAFLSWDNPRYVKLMSLYFRLGFISDMTRVSKEI